MEWKKIGMLAVVGMLVMAALVEDCHAAIESESVKGLNKNELPRKMMNEETRMCPRILEECTTDDDCMNDCICLSNGFCGLRREKERKKGIEKMEWKKIGMLAVVGMLVMAALVEDCHAAIESESVKGLNKNELPRKMMNEETRMCPRILEECTTDDDCMNDCICLSNGFCG
ncbi:uncharacterized protein LOC105435333 [Cucumis sativus]|uniref:uncharacterized protein LOC105435333 n=1 Tax=Cucumis sativus TaxID=3659 RepID=UPI0012F4B3B0|nr:uncharacterized protein LOC105435333 [Cucumis sativus]